MMRKAVVSLGMVGMACGGGLRRCLRETRVRVRVGHVRNRKFLTGQHMRRVGSDGTDDPAGEPFINGLRRVSLDAGTEDGGTGVVVRVRHLR